MTKHTTGDATKDQLMQCISDLADRANELGYPAMGSVLASTVYAEIKGLSALLADDVQFIIDDYDKIDVEIAAKENAAKVDDNDSSNE